jgi:hypothetical protein
MADLPLRTNRLWPIVAAVSTARKTAVLSMPPRGVTLLRRRSREAIVQLVKELYEGNPELGQESEERDDQGMGTGANAGDAQYPGSRADPLIRRRLSEVVAPIRRVINSLALYSRDAEKGSSRKLRFRCIGFSVTQSVQLTPIIALGFRPHTPVTQSLAQAQVHARTAGRRPPTRSPRRSARRH